ncbi:MAG: DUF2157 domain-containing protein [Hyphomicrobium sp.]|nr:DUF2157 domain-containing protein [Hyphomicrobium sp.]
MWGYQKRLAADLSRWKANGWLTDEGEAQIARELVSNRRNFGLAPALGVLASVLLAFAVMSFVAAHWQDIARGARLVILFASMWTGYAVAGMFGARGQSGMSDAAILFAVAVFGASIALISQMFHIDGHAPDGVALWAAGALLSGVLLRSNAAVAFAMGLVAVWGALETFERAAVFWPFLLGWAAVSAAFLWQRWRPGLHLSALAVSAFVIALGYVLSDGHDHALVVALGLMAVVSGLAIERFEPAWHVAVEPVVGYGLMTTFAGAMALQFGENPSGVALIVMASLTLLVLIGSIAYGMSTRRPSAIWLGYLGFSIEILALYAKTVGTILGTSLFFLVAGVLVAALAALAWRLAHRSAESERSS